MVLTLNKNTKILIDNFIDTHFTGENKDRVKEQTLEIIECVLEQSLYKHCDIVKRIKVRDVYKHLGII